MTIKEQIKNFIKDKKISMNKFASIIEVSTSYMSQYLKNDDFKYANTVEEKALKYIDNFIDKNKGVKGGLNNRKTEFIQTKDVKSIFYVIEMAIEEEDLAIIVGRAGLGKSRALEEFALIHPECILIESTIQTNARELFKNISKRLGVVYKGSLDSIVRECAIALKKSDKVLMIDEAEHLPYRALELLRRLQDFSRVPLILAGTNKLVSNLTGTDMDGNEYEQLSSRVGGQWRLEGLSYVVDGENSKVENIDDLISLCEQFDITDINIIKFIKNLTKGNFRKTEKLLYRSMRLAYSYECDISKDIVETASKMLLL